MSQTTQKFMPSKTEKFKELATFKNVFEYNRHQIKTKLQKLIKKNQKIILEVGCGSGAYTIALAELDPKISCIGLDLQGERIWFGAKYALENKISNVYFIRGYAEHLADYFKKKSINEIWLTFPDPHPKNRRATRRLTSERFLKIYQKILKPKGVIHLKTDNKKLFDSATQSIKDFGGQIIKKSKDIYKNKKIAKNLTIKTYYEEMHLKQKRKIMYIKFSV